MTNVLTVLQHDTEVRYEIPRSKRVRVIRTVPDSYKDEPKNVVVLTTMTHLAAVSEFVRFANSRHRLLALCVREDAEAHALPQVLRLSNVRTLRNMLVHSGMGPSQRVVDAWRLGAQDYLIADATRVGDKLIVVNCAMDSFEVPFEAIPALKPLGDRERSDFTIADDGSYLHWSSADVHLDLDAIRYYTDPEWRAEQDQERLVADVGFGKAIASLRRESGLRQADIGSLSERQLRRIEKGSRPRLESLKALAEAHGVSLNDYLNRLAEVMSQLPKTS